MSGLGADVDGLVTEMEALRQALDEADRRRRPTTSSTGDRDAPVTSSVAGAPRLLARQPRGRSAAPACRGSPAVARARPRCYVAAWAGTSRDAYVLANNTPNIIYELILGGDPHRHARAAVHRRTSSTTTTRRTSAVVSVALVAPRRPHARLASSWPRC